MSSFREAAQRLVHLGDTVGIDENLFSAQTRSGHLVQIDNKAAGSTLLPADIISMIGSILVK
jgi:hypothetical protein